MSMTIRILEIFLEVVKTGSMSMAAKNLYISQPTVSHAISSLESKYNTQLFDRTPNRLYLTQAGILLEREAQNVLQAIQHLEDSMSITEETVPINLGVSVSVASSILDDLVSSFNKIHQKVKVKTLISNTYDIENALNNNDLDIAIVSGEIHNPLIETCNTLMDYQVCVCRSDYYLAKKKDVALKELCDEEFVMLLGNRWTRNTFENYVNDNGYSLNVICECSNTGLVKERILNSGGVTIISLRVVYKEIKSGLLSIVPCKGCLWSRPFVMAYKKQKYLSKPLRDFIELSKSFSDKLNLDIINDIKTK